MKVQDYLEVNFAMPMIFLSVGIIFLLLGIPCLVHGISRRRKFPLLPNGLRTWRKNASIRTELIVGVVGIFGAVVLSLFYWMGYSVAISNLETNIESRYSASEVKVSGWNGSWGKANLTLPDGKSFTGVQVVIRDEYEPFIWDVWNHERKVADGS